MAAKHLFRHLHEPRSLRRNPLVRRLFGDARAGGGAIGRDVLERIHELVRRGADHCRASDLATGKDERAIRQHAIVTLHCLGRRPIREVAAMLGISYQHCYRERADICRRIAYHIGEQNDTRTALDHLPELDDFQLLVSRVVHQAAIYDTATAFRACDQLVRAAQSVQQQIVALCTHVSIAIALGDLERAKGANSAAQALYTQYSPRSPSWSWNVTQSYLDVSGARLKYYEGQKLGALRMAQRAALRLEPIQSSAPAHAKELYTETLHDLGAWSWSIGDLERGYEFLCLAEASLRAAPKTSFRVRTRIMLALWKARNSLLMASKTWYPSCQRLEGLLTAFEETYASGQIFDAIDALDAIAQYHAFAGNDDEAFSAGRRAYLLAKRQGNERMLAEVAVQVALMLQRTRYSSSAGCFLPATLSLCDDYHRELASYFAAKRALQSNHFEDAWLLATGACERKKYFTLTARQQMLAAEAAGRLGRRRQAHTIIEDAVSIAERLGSAPVLRDAYLAAADVTAEARFRRKATEVQNLLAT